MIGRCSMSERRSPENLPGSTRRRVLVVGMVSVLSTLWLLLWCIVAAVGHRCPRSEHGSLLANQDQYVEYGNQEPLKQKARRDEYRRQCRLLRAVIETDQTRQWPQHGRGRPP